MIEYRTRFKRCLELWFDAPEPPGDFDVVVRHRSPRPGKKGVTTNFYTLQLDLTKSCDELFAGFDRNTRAQIKKSTSLDDLRIEFFDHPSMIELDEFMDFYDQFAESKQLPLLHRARIHGHRDSGCLSLTRVMHEGKPLTWHANVRYMVHVGMMFSASHFRSEDSPEMRKMIGRANRRLHWEELQHYKNQGCKIYDFGGWYEGTTDKQRLLINQFKEGFGGTQVLAYTSEEQRTPLAKLISLWNRLRGLAVRRFIPLIFLVADGFLLPLHS